MPALNQFAMLSFPAANPIRDRLSGFDTIGGDRPLLPIEISRKLSGQRCWKAAPD